MSFSASATEIPARRFPLTRRGLAFLGLSLAVAAVGAVRMELAALLWGSSFLLVSLYAAAGALFLRGVVRRHLRRTPDAVDCRLPARGLFPGTPALARVEADLPRLLLPGFRLAFRADFGWQSRPPLRLQAWLAPGVGVQMPGFRPRWRGCYRSHAARVAVGDLAGLAAAEILLPLAEEVRVLPAAPAPVELAVPQQEGGQEPSRQRRRVRSDELLETRKYFPGDDPRRINWKLYAHLGQVFLRIGEESPPPRSRSILILDTSFSPLLPSSLEADYLDRLIERCLAVAEMLLLAGRQVLLATCAWRAPRAFAPEKRLELLGRLAELWWSERCKPELPAERGVEAWVFSTPGSAAVEGIAAAAAERAWKAHLCFAAPGSEGREGPSRLRRLLFVPAGAAMAEGGGEAAAGEARSRRAARAEELRFRSSFQEESRRLAGRFADVRTL